MLHFSHTITVTDTFCLSHIYFTVCSVFPEGVNRPGRGRDDSIPSSADVKNG